MSKLGLYRASMTEAQMLDGLKDAAAKLGYLAYHNLYAPGSDRGFPDLTIVGHRRTWFLELKGPRGRIDAGQVAWNAALTDAGLDARFVWPDDYDGLLEELRRAYQPALLVGRARPVQRLPRQGVITMLIAPAGEWRALAEHLETGKVKSSARFLKQFQLRRAVIERIWAETDGRIDTTLIEIGGGGGFREGIGWLPKGWDGNEERSLFAEARHKRLTGFREPPPTYTSRRDEDVLEHDTLKPLRKLRDELACAQQILRDCFQRVCFALDPSDTEGAAGGGIDDYAGDEAVLRLLADAHRLALDLADLGQHIYARACERGL